MVLRRRNSLSDNVCYDKGRHSSCTLPNFNEFIEERNYTGALALLEFDDTLISNYTQKDLWKAYCYFRMDQYENAQELYFDIVSNDSNVYDDDENAVINLAITYYHMRLYSEAKKVLEDTEDSPLKNRLLYHLFHKQNNKEATGNKYQLLGQSKEDQLSIASMYFIQNRFQDAIEIYKRLLMGDKDDVALNLFIAMCYFKLV